MEKHFRLQKYKITTLPAGPGYGRIVWECTWHDSQGVARARHAQGGADFMEPDATANAPYWMKNRREAREHCEAKVKEHHEKFHSRQERSTTNPPVHLEPGAGMNGYFPSNGEKMGLFFWTESQPRYLNFVGPFSTKTEAEEWGRSYAPRRYKTCSLAEPHRVRIGLLAKEYRE